MSRPPSASANTSQQATIESPFLPLATSADDVQFPLVDDPSTHSEDEAALEALRAAISGSHNEPQQQPESGPATLHQQSQVGSDPELPHPTLVSAGQVQVQSIDKAVVALQQLSAASQAIVDNMNAQSILQGLMGSFKLLAESNRRQVELVKNLVDSVQGRGPPTVDPSLSIAYVPRSEYDALKARYDALLSTSAAPAPGGVGTSRRARSVLKHSQTQQLDDDPERLRDAVSETPLFESADEKRERVGRKRRSMKLEHLVHKMANRRLGVEYPVSSFESKGTRDLPDPNSIPPSAADSANAVDEYRPDFRADVSSSTVRPFLDSVVQDCKASWAESFAADEPDVDEDQIVKAVHTYWTRLGKRYDEQLTRERGEVHKDELTRRKQNQYRRQQSLVARRSAAFDTSPLNLCKLRALYRTLLTIDFAAMTNERPDPKRSYTDDEWHAYRKQACGARANEAHEVVDQFWLSNNARSLLTILDTYAFDMSSKLRRKGRPKQPAPTFHLPPDLWDRSNLPLLRPKDAQGLPVGGAGGIILFRFHVDEKVQAEFPDWAQGLYDNPPVPDEDRLLPNLPDVMNSNAFYHLKPKVKTARDAATVLPMSQAEIQELLARPEGDTPAILDEAGVSAVASAAAAAAQSAGADADTSFDLSGTDFMSARGLESIVGSLMAPFATPATPGSQMQHSTTHPLLPLALDSVMHAHGTPGVAGATGAHGPSPGSSVRARKHPKRMMSEVPGGAATPVPKKRRGGGEPEPEVDLSGDASFLDTL